MITEKNYQVIRKFHTKGSWLYELKKDNNLFMKKIYEEDGYKAKLEFNNINKIREFLIKNNYKECSYKALEYDVKEKSILMEKVEGDTLQAYLLKNNLLWSPKLNQNLLYNFNKLGKIFRLIQEEYKISNISVKDFKRYLKQERINVSNRILDDLSLEDVYIKNKIFAAATCNFIYNKKRITPIDLGSKNEKIINYLSVARFLNFLRVPAYRPWYVLFYNWKQISILEKEFLNGYLQEKENYKNKTLLNILKIISLNNISASEKGIWSKMKHFYLMFIVWFYNFILKHKLKLSKYYAEKLKYITSVLGNDLDWCFYKGDILYSYVCEDIDVICRETRKEAEKILLKKGFKHVEGLLYEFDGIKFHFHFESIIHQKIIGQDIGNFILNKKILSNGIYRPKYLTWSMVRLLYFIQRPRGWLKKQLKRIIIGFKKNG